MAARHGLTILVLTTLLGCGTISPTVDDLTGTTLEQRCLERRAAIMAWQHMLDEGEALSENTRDELELYKAFVVAYCPPVTQP